MGKRDKEIIIKEFKNAYLVGSNINMCEMGLPDVLEIEKALRTIPFNKDGLVLDFIFPSRFLPTFLRFGVYYEWMAIKTGFGEYSIIYSNTKKYLNKWFDLSYLGKFVCERFFKMQDRKEK